MSQILQPEQNVDPEQKVQMALCEAVSNLLRIDEVMPEDDFFALGGDSITAMALSTRMRKLGFVVKAKDIFTRKVLADIALAAKPRKAKKSRSKMVATSLQINPEQWERIRHKYGKVKDVLPTLPLQKGLYFQSQLAESGSNYNAVSILECQGEFERDRLQQALDNVVCRFPQLWMRFDSKIMNEPVQILVEPERGVMTLWPLDEVDLNHHSLQEQGRQLESIRLQEVERRFDVTDSSRPLLFCRVVNHGDNRHTIILSEHHLIVDGWSTPLILNALLDGYHRGDIVAVNELTSYANMVQQLTSRDKKRAEQLWREQLIHVTPTMAYDGDIERHDIREHTFMLSPLRSQQLYALCRQKGLTVNTVMQGVWAMILGSMTGREDVVFGSPISGRFADVSGIEQQVGLFTNTIPVRLALQPHQSLFEQLIEIQQGQISLLENDVLGLGDIQRLVGGESLFDTMLSVENYPDEDDWFGRCYHQLTLNNMTTRGYTHYPMTLFVVPGEQLQMMVAYRNDKYAPHRIATQVEQLLEQIIDHPDYPVRHYSLQSEADRALLLRINQTDVVLPETTLRAMMRERSQQQPDSPALLDVDHQFTYQQMRFLINGLANQLSNCGVGRQDIVAVALPRSVTLSLAINAVIESAAVYLPLDVSYPSDRLHYMVDDAKPALIVTTSEYAALFADKAQLLLLDQLPLPANELVNNLPLSPNDGAYIIYTSGSTGNPKGVLVSHRAIMNRLAWMQHEYPLDSSDVILQKTPCSFDVSVWEFFWALIEGASLMMAPPEVHKDPDALLHLIEDYHVTTCHFVPSMLAAFIAYIDGRTYGEDARIAPTLRRVFCSGEALTKELSVLYRRHIQAPLHNLYGPTEAAVDVTYCPAFGDVLNESASGGVPIGLPVWNTQLRILDSFLREVPIGVPGELYLTGQQLAVGYLNRASLTADRFVADPYGVPGERMYRTGDVVRWLSSGKVEYLGRSDDQLKIRGQRIELGEIESCLQQLPGIHQAVVCAKKLEHQSEMAGADNRQLVGYVIASENTSSLDTNMLRQQAKALLPSHMVPVSIVELDAFPLSANGKLDRKSLPLPTLQGHQQGRVPATETECIVAELFCKLLQVESVTVKDDFFSLGGHSLLCMRLAAEIQEKTKQTISVGQIIINPTVEALAQCLEQGTDGQSMVGLEKVLPIRRGEGTPLICINPASGFSWLYTGLLRYLGGHYPIIGLQSPSDGGAIATAKTMDEACDMYYAELKQVQPDGPYHLAGYSFGGNVAHTLAARLQSEGKEVAFVGLFDTYPTECQDWDAAMNEEVAEKEKAAFLEDKNGGNQAMEMGSAQQAMLADIDANYGYSVDLMATAKTAYYPGRIHLFVADQTFPDFNIDDVWSQYAAQLTQLHIDTRHQDILEPETLKVVGPMLDRVIRLDTQLK